VETVCGKHRIKRLIPAKIDVQRPPERNALTMGSLAGACLHEEWLPLVCSRVIFPTLLIRHTKPA